MTARDIIARVAHARDLQSDQLQKPAERVHDDADVKRARSEAMALVRDRLGYSLPKIARLFGGYHHSSVIAAIRRANKRAGGIEALRSMLVGLAPPAPPPKAFEKPRASNQDVLDELRTLRAELRDALMETERRSREKADAA